MIKHFEHLILYLLFNYQWLHFSLIEFSLWFRILIHNPEFRIHAPIILGKTRFLNLTNLDLTRVKFTPVIFQICTYQRFSSLIDLLVIRNFGIHNRKLICSPLRNLQATLCQNYSRFLFKWSALVGCKLKKFHSFQAYFL